LSQVQSTVTKLLTSVSGTDTITAVGAPVLSAYAAGQMFYFVAAGDNTGAVTLNIDSLGAKAVTRDGSVALAAGDIKSGEVVVVVYDGTRFQVVSQLNSAGDARFANVSIASSLYVGGVATIVGNAGFSANVSITSALSVGGAATITGATTVGGALTLSGGTANGVLYLNGSKAATSGTALVFDGTNLGIGTSSPGDRLDVSRAAGNQNGGISITNTDNNGYGGALSFYHKHTSGGSVVRASYIDSEGGGGNSFIRFATTISGTLAERMRLDSSGNLGIGTSSPAVKLDVQRGSEGEYLRVGGDDTGNNGRALRFTSSTSGGFIGALHTLNAPSSGGVIAFATNSTERARITSAGSFVAGASAALATTATDGFLYVPTCAGTPTGTPTAITGMAPIVVNTTNNKLYFYSGGAWRDAGP
jgi:hypothetical protein